MTDRKQYPKSWSDKRVRSDIMRRFYLQYPFADKSVFFPTNSLHPSGDKWGDGIGISTKSGQRINILNKKEWEDDSVTEKTIHKYLFINKPPSFPKIWSGGGTVHALPKGKAHGSVENRWYDGFPGINVLDYPISDFRVYVNGKDYFLSKLPKVATSRSSAEKWDDKESYYQVLFATYCASYCCGVGMQHLDPGVYPVITSIMRFHLYFTVRRIVRRIQGGFAAAISREFGAGEFYGQVGKIPRSEYWKTVRLSDGTMGEKAFHSLRSDYTTDYRKYIPVTSDGFTKIGLQYLNQSIEAYVYCVLGAQSNTRVSIVGHGGGLLEAQQVFRRLVEDSVVNYSISTWILNMNKAIQDTNVVQNLAISPSLWLVPSKMVLLKSPIPGYNNVLRTATDSGMKFGVNSGLNYKKLKQTAHQNKSLVRRKLNEGVVRPSEDKSLVRRKLNEGVVRPSEDKTLVAVLTVSGIVGYFASRYVL